MKQKNIYFYTNLLAWGLVFFLIGNYAFGWTTPTGNPPTSNLSAPINLSSTAQSKTGYLAIATSTTPSYPLDVAGSVNATAYYGDGSNLTGISAGQWTENGSDIYYNTGNVGIGTTAPKNKLDVEGGGVIGATYSGTNTAPSNGLLVEGNVGIGTTAPVALLNVAKTNGTLNALIGDYIAISNSAANLQVTNTSGNSTVRVGQDVTHNGYLSWTYNATAGSAGMYLSTYGGNNPLVLQDSGGNVGIGTTAPDYKLDVSGTGRFTQPVIVGSPTADTHAATKGYVDSTVGGAGFEPAITAGTTAQYWRGDKSWQTLNSTAVGLGNVTNESKATMFASPTFTGTVSGVTKAMVGLGSVDNTADTAKPVSTAQQTALNLKANLASPTFTGTVTAPTFSGALSGNATSATTASDVSCTNCLTSTEVASADRAYDLFCTNCIGATEISDIYVYNTGDTMNGDINMGGHKITTLSSPPTSDFDAATKAYVDDGDSQTNHICTWSTTYTATAQAFCGVGCRMKGIDFVVAGGSFKILCCCAP